MWSSKLPPRILVWLWRALWNKLRTKANLIKRGASVDPWCPFCINQLETLEHCLFLCPFSTFVGQSTMSNARLPSLEGKSAHHWVWLYHIIPSIFYWKKFHFSITLGDFVMMSSSMGIVYNLTLWLKDEKLLMIFHWTRTCLRSYHLHPLREDILYPVNQI